MYLGSDKDTDKDKDKAQKVQKVGSYPLIFSISDTHNVRRSSEERPGHGGAFGTITLHHCWAYSATKVSQPSRAWYHG
jgi:hypothetical protein